MLWTHDLRPCWKLVTMASTGPEGSQGDEPGTNNKDAKERPRWTDLLTPISIVIAAIGLLVNFAFQFQSQITENVTSRLAQSKEEIQNALRQERDLFEQKSQIAAQKLAGDYEAKMREIRAELSRQAAELKSDSAALDRIVKLPQAGLAFKPIEISASASNCENVTVQDILDRTHTSKITAICTISKEALKDIPENAKIVVAEIANSHYNLRLTTNKKVGSIDISELAKAQSASDRGSEGHAETIITLNDLTRQGGTFFVSRPSQEGWSPHTDTHWLWIGWILVYYYSPT